MHPSARGAAGLVALLLVALVSATPAAAVIPPTMTATLAASSPAFTDQATYRTTGTITSAVGTPTVLVSCDENAGLPFLPATVTPGSSPGAFTFAIDCTYGTTGLKQISTRITDDVGSPSGGNPGLVIHVTALGGGTPGGGGSSGGGTGGSGSCLNPSAELSYAPQPAYWGTDVTFNANLSCGGDLGWSFALHPELSPPPIVLAGPAGLVKTTTTSYMAAGSFLTSVFADTSSGRVAQQQRVNIYGRTQYITVDCGTPVFGLPATLSATLTDLSPSPSAVTLSNQTVNFTLNGVVIGSGTTGAPTSATTAQATLTTTFTMAPGGSYTCGAFIVQPPVLYPLYETGNTFVTSVVAQTMPPGYPTFPVGTRINPNGTFTLPDGTIVPQQGAIAAGAPKPLVLLSTPGKVEGEAKCADGTKASFAVQALSATVVKGELEYQSATLSFHAKTFIGLGISADARTAVFMGTGQTRGKTPATVPFLVKVVDNGQHRDTVQISFDGGKTFGARCGGEVHIKAATAGKS